MDLIVLGITLRQRFEPNILGATTNYVLKHAPCEVMLVRERIPAAVLSRV
ncbi:MAG: universal stress protein [Dehalococcoidia bacterium]